jgi:hypothetical protein
VKRLFLVGCLLAVSFATTQAAAAPRFGVAEDATKYAQDVPSVSAFIVGKPVRSVSKLVKAGWTPRFELRGRLKPGWYVYAIRLQAATNPSRPRTLASVPFRVGRPQAR